VYVRRLPDERLPPGGGQFHRRVWRRRLGAPLAEDRLLFGEGRDPTTYYELATSEDGRWLTVSASLGTAPRNDLYLADLGAPGEIGFVAVQEGVDAVTNPHIGPDGRLYLHTNLGAPRWRLAVADPARPEPAGWTDLLPEEEDVLSGWAVTGDAVAAVRTRDVVSRVTVHDRGAGTVRAQVPLPGLGTAWVSARPEGGDDVWIAYTDHLSPTRVLHWSVAEATLAPWAEPPGWPPDGYGGAEARQVFVASPDGTRVPLFLLGPPGARPDRPRPTVLTGYGGFGVARSPEYSAAAAAWVEAGGIWAVANLRGGSEYGEAWHRDGMRQHKQHVFDDFLAAAAWLVEEGWASPDRLGVSGGSNGGLLVGAALTQAPDRLGAVVCSAPLLDMVRYERWGLGVTWNDEYGTAGDPEELGWLLSYSPYHHVEPGRRYPATLLTVFDADTRVDPAHARKMAAALQWATSARPEEAPVLLRTEADVGHSTRSTSRTVALSADTSAFLADRLGLWPGAAAG
ncbi:MAG: prolyl oligopeptidase family serine peptidase, partial [Acidimicrobiales bacterium]